MIALHDRHLLWSVWRITARRQHDLSDSCAGGFFPEATSRFGRAGDAVEVAFGAQEQLPARDSRRCQRLLFEGVAGQHLELWPGPDHEGGPRLAGQIDLAVARRRRRVELAAKAFPVVYLPTARVVTGEETLLRVDVQLIAVEHR